MTESEATTLTTRAFDKVHDMNLQNGILGFIGIPLACYSGCSGTCAPLRFPPIESNGIVNSRELLIP
eukprot:397597-Prorocentrum_minimum.AAC.1